MGEFSGKGRGELGSPIEDDLVVKAESGEDVVEEDLGNICRGGGFVARAENYPLQKAMVNHNQNRIVAMGEGEISDEVHGDLLEGVGALREDGSKGGWEGWVFTLLSWQVAQPAMNLQMKVVIPGHQ